MILQKYSSGGFEKKKQIHINYDVHTYIMYVYYEHDSLCVSFTKNTQSTTISGANKS